MVAVLAMTVNPLSPSSSSSSAGVSYSITPALNPPVKVRAFAAASATPVDHACLCRSSELHQQQLKSLMRLQLSNHMVVQCKGASTAMASSTFLSNTDSKLFSLLQEIGINEREAALMLLKNPPLRFAPFNSVRSRIDSLQQLGLDGILLSGVILKRPKILTAEELDGFIRFLRDDLDNKVEPNQIERLLHSAEPRFLLGFEEKVELLLQYGIPQEKFSHVLNGVNITKAFVLKSYQEVDRTLTFLSRFGGANLILKRPAILNYDLDTQLLSRIGVLKDLSGGDEDATGAVLLKLPAVLAYTADHLKDHVEFFRSFAGLNDQEIFKIVLVYPNLFSASRKRKLHPRVVFLKQCGLSSHEIYKFLTKAPLFLSLSFDENIAFKLVFLVKIGYESKTKDLAMAMGAVTRTSSKNLQEVVGLFLNYGLTCDDILAMSKKHPQILQYNHESLEEKLDYLINDMGREIGELLAFPAFLGYKLDSRIKLRYEAKKNILGEGMSLNKLLSESAERFSMNKEKKSSIL